MKKSIGRPMKKESMLEELLMEVQAGAMSLLEEVPTGQNDARVQRGILKRIIEAANFAQSVNQGLRTRDGHFNGHLLEFMGEEKLS